MSYGIFLPKRWTSQPQGFLEVDWSNPIARLLRVAIVGGQEISSAYRLSYSRVGTATVLTPSPTPGGMGWTLTGTNSSSHRIRWDASPVGSAMVAGRGVFALSRCLSLPTETSTFEGPGASIDEFSQRHAVATTSSGGTVYFSGRFRDTGGTARLVLGASSPTVGQTVALGFCDDYPTQQQRLYVDGALDATGTTYLGASGGYRYFMLGAGASQFNTAVAYYWVRAPSSEEMRSLYEAPYQLLKPRHPIIYSLPAGGGAVSGSFSATESGSDTAVVFGDVLVEGSFAATESGADTAAFAGDVLVQGTLAANESGADTAAFEGGLGIIGTLAASETGADTAAFAGVVLISGVFAAVESGADVAAFSGAILVSGSFAAVEAASDTASFIGEGVDVGGIMHPQHMLRPGALINRM